jgi:hypothetical protein
VRDVGHAERLGVIDASFLANESPNAHMLVAAALVFEGGALLRPDGGVDVARIRRVASAGAGAAPLDAGRAPARGAPRGAERELDALAEAAASSAQN